jgi:hypothetical protein
VPDHVPLLAVRVWVSWGVPEIEGGVTFDGGTPWTTDVCPDMAEALPPPLEAVTTTRTVCPTSLDLS